MHSAAASIIPSIPGFDLAINIGVLVVSFFILTKTADFLVDGAVGIATRMKIPKILIGIVLVGLATTAPEFTVSVIASFRGQPEMALGNAIGSVIADDALALALGVVLAPTAVILNTRILKTTGLFLVFIELLSFGLAMNGVISRLEGIILLALLIPYMVFLIIDSKKNPIKEEAVEEVEEHVKKGTLGKQFLLFAAGVAGVIVASRFLVESATNMARIFGVSEVIISLTLVAIGTSLPEIATCITACRKGHGDLAFGDILGADILNILWIVGAASAVNPISVEKKVIFFAFPAMMVVVFTMMLLALHKSRMTKAKGIILLLLYAAYFPLTLFL